MKKFQAHKVYSLGTAFGDFCARGDNLKDHQKSLAIQPGELEVVLRCFPNFIAFADDIGLPTASMPLAVVLKKLKETPQIVTYSYLDAQQKAFKSRVHDELTKLSFYQLQADRAKYYDEARSMFNVADAFPSSQDDIDEAGKCLAVGRPTACVFHLMRCLGPVLKAVGNELGIVVHLPTWDAYLKKFDEHIGVKFPTKTPLDVAGTLFYKDVEAHFYTVKDGWRNPSIHDIAKVYTEEQAEGIFNSVKSLMQKIAEKVKENP